MDELLTEQHLRKYWQRQECLSTWIDSGYNSSNTTADSVDFDYVVKSPAEPATTVTSEKKPHKSRVTFESPIQQKQVHLNFFETACRGNHECAGQWARPGDNSCTKDSLEYYVNMAKLAEKAKITAIFFADTYAGHDVYGGNMDAILRAGTQVAQLDPLVIISAMAASITISQLQPRFV